MKMLTLILSIFLANISYAQTDTIPPKPEGKPITLLGITGVNSLFSDSTESEAAIGGGLGMERMFSTLIYPNLRPCGRELHSAGSSWIKQHKLIPAREMLSETEVIFEIWRPDYEGLFVLKYKCTEDGSYARTWLDYYKKTGEVKAVETVNELYTTYNIAALWDEIQKSMGCGLN